MKVELDYQTFKTICLAMVETVRPMGFDEIICVMRGGMSASHIISKALNKPCGAFFPGVDNKLFLNSGQSKSILFVEDLIAKGRTYNTICSTMYSFNKDLPKDKHLNWKFCSVLIDDKFFPSIDKNVLVTYGLVSPHWVVMPYEESEKMVEGDHGLFRNGSDKYGK